MAQMRRWWCAWQTARANSGKAKKRFVLLSFPLFVLLLITLPRQAWVKHKENSKQRPFSRSNFFLAELNFTGWRNITVHAPQARQLFEYPLIAQNTAMRYFRWSQITSMTVAVTNALSANIAIR